ncbi:Hypothetical protein KNT65_gp208 [Escherichia phage EcS1]|uniref:Uncharacterized protein n=1 Tax=Escherichia phage EcS1 TaxID=2083276 RepID=A0A2Z5ZCS5_9CAUD|nr:Hypothetical protein KNT65_gp208 [Escherichia phage EcS1]BBC78285.1 Hypothetical protein [Escherichia phage EcS1]
MCDYLEDISELYDLIEEIEERKCFIFVVHHNEDGVALDIRDYDTEETVDGGHFTHKSVFKYVEENYL